MAKTFTKKIADTAFAGNRMMHTLHNLRIYDAVIKDLTDRHLSLLEKGMSFPSWLEKGFEKDYYESLSSNEKEVFLTSFVYSTAHAFMFLSVENADVNGILKLIFADDEVNLCEDQNGDTIYEFAFPEKYKHLEGDYLKAQELPF